MAGVYEKVELLGSGSYGKAWLVNNVGMNKKAVLKEIKLDCLGDKEIRQAMVEVKVLAKCRHVNIVSYCEAFLSSDCLNIVMEHADSGDLQKKIVDQKGRYFDKETVMDFFIQICFALKYLHSENVLHRDLKPQNLFLTSDGIVKVGDFGIARVMENTADYAQTAIGTPYYLSPEICEQKLYNHKSDMWSAGCVLYELCCLKVPFQAPNLPLLVLKIVEGCYDPIPSQFGAVLEDLVAVLLKADPLQRPSAEQVLSVPALQHQVKLTYRKCIGHKQQRLKQRALSRETASPSVPSQKTDGVLPRGQTFTVRSPLLRRLSVATPQLVVAKKRTHSARFAEVVTSVKKQRKNSRPPVLNLQEAVISPSLHSESPSFDQNDIFPEDVEEPDTDVFDDTDVTKDYSDVFDDTDVTTDCNSWNSPSNISLRKTNNPIHRHPTSPKINKFSDKKEISRERQNSSRRKPVEKSESPCAVKHRPSNERLMMADKQLNLIKQSCMSPRSERYEQSESDSRQNGLLNLHHCTSTETEVQEPANSHTYTVSPEREIQCSVCQDEPYSQDCLHQALYAAASFSYRDKSSAQRCLSHFLITHLGSKLSLHVCALVNSALRAGKDYSSVEKILDESCKSYLPVIFQILTLCGESDQEIT